MSAWCPIANYLRDAEPSLYTVAVLGDAIEVSTGNGHDITVQARDEVTEFVANFDHQHYPRLLVSAQLTPVTDPGTTIGKEDRL